MNVFSQPAHGLGLWSGVLFLLAFALCRVAAAAEITPFRLTAVDGSLELTYDHTAETTEKAGVTTSDQRVQRFAEIFEVRTRSYVYHPNLLKLDADLGLDFTQDRNETNGVSSGVNGRLISYDLRASILEKKPYPLVLFANRDTVTSYPTLGERLTQTSTGYGLSLRLIEPFVPATMVIDAQHENSTGGSSRQVVDSASDRVSVMARKSYGGTDFVDGSLRWSRQESGSGATAGPVNPITRTLTTNTELSLGSGNTFGERDQFVLTNSATYKTEQGTTEREDFSFNPTLRWKYSDDLDAYANYSINVSDQGDLSSSNQHATASMRLAINEDLSSRGSLKWRDTRTEGTQTNSIGGSGNLRYEKLFGPVGVGLLANIDYERREQESSDPTATVLEEPIILTDFVPVELANEYVLVGTIVVRNLQRTQVYTEGVDYEVETIGATTTIERILTGNIQNGEQVLVDYDYQTGGTYAADHLGYSLAADASFYKYYRVFFSYGQQDVSLVDGVSTLPLNSSSTIRYGAAVSNYPLPMRARANLRLDFTHQREEVSPSDSANLQIDVSAPLGRRTHVVAGFQKSIVDNLDSAADTDRDSYHLLVRSRPTRALGVSGELRHLVDTGGVELSESWTGSVRADWRRYRLQVSASADYSLEKQGDVTRNGFGFSLAARREF